MRKLIVVIFLIAAAPVFAEDTLRLQVDLASTRWNASDTTLELVFVGLALIDWLQTVNFTQNLDDGRHELNPILGPHPSRARVNTLIPLGIVLHVGIAYMLPKGWMRTTWQMTFIVVETITVTNNIVVGAGITVPWG